MTHDRATAQNFAFSPKKPTAIIVASGVEDGIERASKILMPALLAIILFLALSALTLPDAWRGLAFYLLPDFSKFNGTVVTGAFAHAFFSLSLGLGALMTYGSYLSQIDFRRLRVDMAGFA